MLRNTQKCTISEAQRVTGNINWNVALHELVYWPYYYHGHARAEAFLTLLVCGTRLGSAQCSVMPLFRKRFMKKMGFL